MARYKEAVCRLCRREGVKLFLKGQRCLGPKCAVDKRPYPPGQAGEAGARRRRPGDYALQLREKQKLRSIYGMLEKPFRAYVRTAERLPGVAGVILLQLLERRLDNVVFRAGFAQSRPEARQLVAHRHVQVNGRTVDVPSFRVRIGDVVKIAENDKGITPVVNAVNLAGGRPGCPWMTVDLDSRTTTFNAIPQRSEIDVNVNETQVMEFYSR
jgi:small subunit ribosomal protein S4